MIEMGTANIFLQRFLTKIGFLQKSGNACRVGSVAEILAVENLVNQSTVGLLDKKDDVKIFLYYIALAESLKASIRGSVEAGK